MGELDDILNNGEKGKLPEEMLQAYLEGRLSPEQQHEVEAWLAEEGMESDAVEGLKELTAHESKQLVDRLNYDLRHELGKKKRHRKAITDNQWAWLAILIVLMLCVLGFVVLKMMDRKADNYQTIVKDTARSVSVTSLDSTQEKLIKFEPKFDFKSFAVDTFTDTPAKLNFAGNSTAKRFKTRITDTYREEGLNFAGHYCFVYWGCGSPCQSAAIVDLKTGKIYDGPNAALGYEFYKDSRMVIVNPPSGGGMYSPKTGYYIDCIYCVPEIWVWDESSKKFQQKQ